MSPTPACLVWYRLSIWHGPFWSSPGFWKYTSSSDKDIYLTKNCLMMNWFAFQMSPSPGMSALVLALNLAWALWELSMILEIHKLL